MKDLSWEPWVVLEAFVACSATSSNRWVEELYLVYSTLQGHFQECSLPAGTNQGESTALQTCGGRHELQRCKAAQRYKRQSRWPTVALLRASRSKLNPHDKRQKVDFRRKKTLQANTLACLRESMSKARECAGCLNNQS